MRSVMVHPVWWPPPQRLAFLIAVSDRVEGEDRAVRSAQHGFFRAQRSQHACARCKCVVR